MFQAFFARIVWRVVKTTYQSRLIRGSPETTRNDRSNPEVPSSCVVRVGSQIVCFLDAADDIYFLLSKSAGNGWARAVLAALALACLIPCRGTVTGTTSWDKGLADKTQTTEGESRVGSPPGGDWLTREVGLGAGWRMKSCGTRDRVSRPTDESRLLGSRSLWLWRMGEALLLCFMWSPIPALVCHTKRNCRPKQRGL